MASGSLDGTVRVWNVATLKEVKSLVSMEAESVKSVTYSQCGKYLASASGKIIRLWDAKSYQEVSALTDNKEEVLAIAFSTDSKYIASGSGDGTVRVWNLL